MTSFHPDNNSAVPNHTWMFAGELWHVSLIVSRRVYLLSGSSHRRLRWQYTPVHFPEQCHLQRLLSTYWVCWPNRTLRPHQHHRLSGHSVVSAPDLHQPSDHHAVGLAQGVLEERLQVRGFVEFRFFICHKSSTAVHIDNRNKSWKHLLSSFMSTIW